MDFGNMTLKELMNAYQVIQQNADSVPVQEDTANPPVAPEAEQPVPPPAPEETGMNYVPEEPTAKVTEPAIQSRKAQRGTKKGTSKMVYDPTANTPKENINA